MAKRKPRKSSKVLPESVQAALGDTPETVGDGDTPFGIPASGSISERRIRTCADARELYVRLAFENQLRAQSFAQIRNQIEGGRPFDPNALVRNGEGWRTNVNFNDARAAFRRISTPYWKMVNEVPRRIAVTVHSGSPDVPKWNIALAECFDRFLDDWGEDYYKEFSGIVDDLIMFGTGHPMFADCQSPRYKWAQTVQIMFPRRTKSCVDDWELVCLKREMTASQLIEYVKDDKTKKESERCGWNGDAVMKAIKLAAPQSQQTRFLDPNYFQDIIVTNDLVIGGVWPPVQVVDIWAKNRDGSIQHSIFTERADVGEYLYDQKDAAESFRDIFGTIFYGVGSNGLIHAIKGFGVLNYYYATAINRLKCKALDSVGMTMGLNFVKEDNTPDGTPPVENHSFLNIFPKGLEQLTVYPQIAPAMQMMKELQNNQNENNSNYSESGVQQNIAEAQTKGQADLLANIGSEMETAQTAVFLSQWGRLNAQQFKRLCHSPNDPDAKKFRERAKALGVPKEVFKESMEITVKTGASPTMASPMVRAQVANQLFQTIYPLPGANRRAIEEFYVANATGAEGVNRFLLPVGVASDPRARREAMMENADLAAGIPLPADPSDSHVEHIDEHLKPIESLALAAKQGQPIDPNQLIAFKMVLPHVEEHLGYLVNDETKAEIYKQLNARMAAVKAIATGIEARMARAQRNGAAPEEIRTQLQAPRQ